MKINNNSTANILTTITIVTTNTSSSDITSIATLLPSKHPSKHPSQAPTHIPTDKPSQKPSQTPSVTPSITPSSNDTATENDTAKKIGKWKWDSSSKDSRRNIIFILTDDQDILMSGLTSFNKTMKMVHDINNNNNNINNYGSLIFKNAFVNSPICCVSRTTMLSGRYPQNTQTLTYVQRKKFSFVFYPQMFFEECKHFVVHTLADELYTTGKKSW